MLLFFWQSRGFSPRGRGFSPLPEAEAFLLEAEALLLELETFLLETKDFLLETEDEDFLLEAEDFLLETEDFLLETEDFLLEEEASLLEVEAFLLELEVPLLESEALFLEAENKATFFIFGAEDIFIALRGTRFPLMRMDGISCFDFNAETLLAEIFFEGLFFFASIFGFAADILFRVFRLLETFFPLLIREEEDFLDFLFLLDMEALLTSSSRSLLISRCILLDFDLTMFIVFSLRCVGRLLELWEIIEFILTRNMTLIFCSNR